MKIPEMKQHLRQGGFEVYADIIEAQAERCVGFQMIPTDQNELPVGCSKAGGLPDLPPDYVWPSYQGRPLFFVLQICLEDISGFHQCEELPQKGLLSVFYNCIDQPWGYDPRDRRQWKILYIPEPEHGLKGLARPQGDIVWSFRSCALEFHEVLCPGWTSIPAEAFNLDRQQTKDFYQFLFSLPVDTNHQILGRTVGFQSSEEEMQRRCQWVSNGLYCGGGHGPAFDQRRARELDRGATDWRLLLQLDSDEGAGMEWGDRGQLYFWIRDEDLRQRDFTDVWVILQSL